MPPKSTMEDEVETDFYSSVDPHIHIAHGSPPNLLRKMKWRQTLEYKIVEWVFIRCQTQKF